MQQLRGGNFFGGLFLAMPFSRSILQYKLHAALFSLLVFLVFAAGLAVLVSRVWYPGYLFWLDGGLQGLLLVLAVAFVLGPVLAPVFAHPEKSRRKFCFDVVVVVLLQFSAMGWGSWQVCSQRPLAVVYGNQRFISVAPGILDLQHEDAATLSRFSSQRPPLLYRRSPVGAREEQRMLALFWRAGIHAEAQAWLFERWTPDRLEDRAAQEAARTLIQGTLRTEWEAWVADRPSSRMVDYRFAAFEGRYGSAMLVFSIKGELLGYLPQAA